MKASDFVLEPPKSEIFYNRRRKNGKFPPVNGFFWKAAGLCQNCGDNAAGADYCDRCKNLLDDLEGELSK